MSDLTVVVDAALRAPEILRPEMHGGELRCASRDSNAELDDCTSPCEEVGSQGAVREVRQCQGDGCSPHQRGLAGQPAGEPDSAVPVMPHEGPSVVVRRLTELECERLMGYDDDWTAGQSGSARYRQLGNSVAVPCVEWIARRMVAIDAGLEVGA